MYFDTHAHYDDEQFDPDRLELLLHLPESGVALVVNPGSNMESSLAAIELAENFPFIYAAVGFHPHDAKLMVRGDLAGLETLAKNPRVVAIGEIGLDYHYDHSPREIQRVRFREQLELARGTGLPAIVHEREATRDCLDILRDFRDVRGVVHCFSGSLETAKELVNLGWHLSFTGVVTYKNARRTHEVLRWMPAERIMIETDSPYLSPEPLRGRRNSSKNLPLIAAAVGELRGLGLEETARLTMENGKAFFGVEEFKL